MSGQVRPRQGTEISNFGAPSPLEALHWIFFCFFSSISVQFSKTSPTKSGESSEKIQWRKSRQILSRLWLSWFFSALKRRLWRSQRRKSSSVPAEAANFPAAVFLAGSAQTLAGIAFRAAGKSENHFPAASKFAGKPFQQGISDSHSLLEFSEIRNFGLDRPCLQ